MSNPYIRASKLDSGQAEILITGFAGAFKTIKEMSEITGVSERSITPLFKALRRSLVDRPGYEHFTGINPDSLPDSDEHEFVGYLRDCLLNCRNFYHYDKIKIQHRRKGIVGYAPDAGSIVEMAPFVYCGKKCTVIRNGYQCDYEHDAAMKAWFKIASKIKNGIPRRDFKYTFLHLAAAYRIECAKAARDVTITETGFLEWILFSLISDPLDIKATLQGSSSFKST